MAINGLRVSIGSLPITIDHDNKQQQIKENQIIVSKVHFKTKILEDGSYQTEMVEKNKIDDDEDVKIEDTYFRKLLAEDSIVGGVFTRNIGKMLYRIRRSG